MGDGAALHEKISTTGHMCTPDDKNVKYVVIVL